MRIANILRVVCLTMTALLLPLTTSWAAASSNFDGSRNLLCAPSDVVECDTEARCDRSSAEEIDLPSFVRVQFRKKILLSASGEERSTAIQNILNVNGLTILQGAESGRAWSVVIDQATGRMLGSIADGEGAFTIFGACLPE